MALTKSSGSITQLTATGNSTTTSLAGAYQATAGLKHVNGTGTLSQGAQVQPQWSPDGAAWFDLGGPIAFGTSATATETRTVDLPAAASAVRFVYTAPVGSTGHTLDASVGIITGTASDCRRPAAS